MAKSKSNSRAGIGVDASGGPLIDPTQNVKDLTEQANLRQDDLRKLNNKRINAELAGVAKDIQWMSYVAVLRAEHAKEIRLLESERLDKIRQVDVLAGNTAADRALVAIQTLATSQAAAAETLRSMVTTTATTIAAQTSETVSGLTGRIAALEKSSYEGAGKGQGAMSLWAILGGLALLILAVASFVIAYNR